MADVVMRTILLDITLLGIALLGIALLFPLVTAAQSPEGWLARGDSLRAALAYDEAEAAYERARPEDPIAADLRLGRLFLHLGRWSAAANRFDDVLDDAPENLAAHLGRGITHRERGRFRPPLGLVKELLDWRDAERHFEYVLARDSAFADVLLAYAFLEAYRGEPDVAMSRAYAQRRLRPDLPEAHLGLTRLYRLFLEKDPDGAAAWRIARTDDYAAYFAAETLRLAGQFDAAESALRELLGRDLAMPTVPIHLSMARLYAAKGAGRLTEAYARRALDAVTSPVEAAFVLEDLRPLLTDAELAWAERLATAEDYRAFFAEMWARRDPLPAAEDNPRRVEHYRRLVHVEQNFAFFGYREWWNDPDPQQRLNFTEGYRRRRFFNDKGLIYLRHGAPDDRIATLGADEGANESWRYAGADGGGALVFHFVSVGGAGWRLVPVLIGREVLGDRVHWGDPFVRGYNLYLEAPDRQQMSLLSFTEEMREASQASVDVGLATDRHTWPEETTSLPVPVTMAAFRGADGATDLHVFYAFPTADLSRGARIRYADVEIGLRVWNEHAEAARRIEDKRITLTRDPTGGIIDGFRIAAAPDSYRVALHVRPERGQMVGAFAEGRRLPAFLPGVLAMSDLVLARRVRERDPAREAETAPFVRGDRAFLPNPTARFPRGQALHIVFEAYHLTPGPEGRTAYTLAFTLAPETPRRRGLFRRRDDRPTLSLRTEHSAAAATILEAAELDVRSVDPGAYILTVTLVDTVTGREVSQSTPLRLD